ncbi:MAG: hypothetical protein U0325_17805 [Polyangiales bacterium]
MKTLKHRRVLGAALLALALTNSSCVVEVTPGPPQDFYENFDSGGTRWTLGDGFRVDVASGTDRWLRAVYDDSCADQSYNFAHVTAPFNFTGASTVTLSVSTQGAYGTGDTTGVAWTTDLPGTGATWNVLSSIRATTSYTTNTVELPAEARRAGVYLGIYFRNVCVRNSIGVNMAYDEFRVVVTR